MRCTGTTLRSGTRWIKTVGCVLLIGAAAGAFAQDKEAPAPAATTLRSGSPRSTSETVIERVTPATQKRGLDTQVSVNVREMDLSQAIRLLADEAGINIVVGREVQGVVSCSMDNVTVGSALHAFLYANGYGMIEQDNVLVVISGERKRAFETPIVQAKVVRKTFRLPYTGRERDLVPSSGAISGAGFAAGARTAAAGTKAVEESIRQMLSPNGKMAYYERQHLVIVQDIEDVVNLIEGFVNALWQVPIQVYIDSKLVEITLEEGEAFGMNWTVWHKIGESGQRALAPGGTNYSGTSLRTGVTSNAALEATNPFTYGIVNANIDVVLNAIGKRSRVDLHSNPRILVMNHRTATIIVGQEIPYLSSTETGTANPINTYEFKEVAVRLEVTPHVSEDGIIFLDVHPQVKSKIGETQAPVQPILSTREAVTYVAVRDNETLIIGGLVQRNSIKTRWHTPLLHRIPLLGWFFRQRTDTDTKNDLVFLLNPRILKPGHIRQAIEEKSDLLTDLPKHPAETEAGKRKW